MTDSFSFILTVLIAGLVLGLWLGKALTESRWENAADTLSIRSGGADYHVVRVGDVEKAEAVMTLERGLGR